uniref:Uncharacterized protein n=1 Tax=Lactuca sativa TaxID=4236 RepID=A0A9R1VZU8_LACSA|nr:hypothetical protein LSAT_V11C300126130 [Lactuca sativa]
MFYVTLVFHCDGNRSRGIGNEVPLGYEKKVSVADKFVSDNDTFVSDNDKEAKVGMIELQRHNLFKFGEVPEVDDQRCEEKSNEGWSDDEYTKQKTAFNPWYCIPSILDCPEPILEPGPFHSLGSNDKLTVNQTYNTKKELAFVVKLKAVREKFQIKVEDIQNLGTRLFVCKKTVIGVYTHLSLKEQKCLKLKRLMTSIHVLHYLYTQNHRQANSEVVGTIIHDIMGQGSLRVWKPKDIIRYMNALLQINMSYSQAWHAREFAMGLTMGTPEESFSKLPVYFHNLKKHNPGTVTYIKTYLEDRFE